MIISHAVKHRTISIVMEGEAFEKIVIVWVRLWGGAFLFVS